MITKEIMNDFKENYTKVRKLLDEDSQNDPENLPYMSKYKAKEILNNMREQLLMAKASDDTDIDKIKLDAMLGTVLLNLGIIDMETEERSSSEKALTEAESILSPLATKPEIVITLLKVYNNLGLYWSACEDTDKVKVFLFKAKELYESFKCTMQMPIPIEHLFGSEDAEINEFMVLEKLYTLTLYYLAQLYGNLKEKVKSAMYCHTTLKRQLQYLDYDHIDWALNAAALSQFFAEQNGFYQARHHLAAASTILDEYNEKLTAMQSEDEEFLAKMETFKHRSADVARCWVKYCLILLGNSKQRLMSDSPSDITTDMSNLQLDGEDNIASGDLKSLVFSDLNVSKYVSKISCNFVLTYQDAREVFLCCQSWLNKAKEYYKLDTLASDHIELVQDSSQSYAYLLFFEEDDERRAKMHKRRITMLEDLLKEVNPTYYMQYCRQLWYELAEAYSDVLDIKLDKVKDKPEPHVLKKVNVLSEKSMENYDCFLNSVRDKNGEFPEKLDPDHIRPTISALAFIGRNSMKRVPVNKENQLEHLKKSLAAYQTVVDICKKDEAAAQLMGEEFSLCQDMANVLPIKIRKMECQLMGC